MMSHSDEVLSRIIPRLGDDATARAVKTVELLEACVAQYPVTPIASFELPIAGIVRRIHLKLEGNSPWRSIKGRTAISLVASVAARLTDESLIVESTSGNLGVALAELTHELGIPFSAVVDEALPGAMRSKMVAAGAEVVLADEGLPGDDRLTRRLATVRRLCASRPGVLWTNQYENVMNPLIHEVWTGPEFLRQVPDAQALFAGVSTGGTLCGISRAVRNAGAPIKVVAVDVEGSRALGGPAGNRILTGIGAGLPSRFLDDSSQDSVGIVSSVTGARLCREWRRSTGLGLGGSSGAVVAAALGHMEEHPEVTKIACVCPDLGENYLDTVYDDEWARTRGVGLGGGQEAGAPLDGFAVLDRIARVNR